MLHEQPVELYKRGPVHYNFAERERKMLTLCFAMIGVPINLGLKMNFKSSLNSETLSFLLLLVMIQLILFGSSRQSHTYTDTLLLTHYQASVPLGWVIRAFTLPIFEGCSAEGEIVCILQTHTHTQH